jgi:alpha-ribazole phosphatase
LTEANGARLVISDTSFWLVRHAIVACPAGMISPLDAPADLGDQRSFELVQAQLPKNAQAYASPARRAVDTARALQLDPVLMTELAEQDFGEWIGRTHDQLAATGGESYARFWRDPSRSQPPGGESFEDQIARVRGALAQIETERTILIVHSGTIRAALAIALELAPEAALRFVVDPLSLTRIDRLSNGWRVVSVNQTFR